MANLSELCFDINVDASSLEGTQHAACPCAGSCVDGKLKVGGGQQRNTTV
jgi:hypothetical protein